MYGYIGWVVDSQHGDNKADLSAGLHRDSWTGGFGSVILNGPVGLGHTILETQQKKARLSEGGLIRQRSMRSVPVFRLANDEMKGHS